MKILIAGTLMASMLVVPVMAQDISVYLNNERMIFDQNPIIENGRTLVPLRSIFEGLGAEVKWNQDIQEITGTTEDKEVILRIGDTSASVNGEEVVLDVPAKIKSGRTLVPLRFISESLNAEVKWDADTYRIDIEESKYDYIGEYSEGLALVRKEGRYGYIDREGKEVIPCRYVLANDFSEEVAIVGMDINNQNICIDKEGNELFRVIDGSWGNMLSSFEKGLATLSSTSNHYNYVSYIDKDGKVYLRGSSQMHFPLGSETEINSDPRLELIETSENKVILEKEGKYGFADEEGNEIIPCVYDYVYEFSNGVAKVKKEGKYGFIDEEGNEIIPCIYDYAYNEVENFKDDMTRVRKEGKYGFIDKDGNEIIPCIYDYASAYVDEKIRVKQDDLEFYIDKLGNEIQE